MGKFEESAAKNGLVARNIKNAAIVNLWILVWAITLGVTSYLSDFQWYSSLWVSLTGFCIHALVSVAMVLAYKKFLTEADELERNIQLGVFALSVGVTIVFFQATLY